MDIVKSCTFKNGVGDAFQVRIDVCTALDRRSSFPAVSISFEGLGPASKNTLSHQEAVQLSRLLQDYLALRSRTKWGITLNDHSLFPPFTL